MAQAQVDDRHPLISLVSAFFWVILWLLSCTKALIAFLTIRVPRLIYAVLSYSMTLTLNFWSFALLFMLSAFALNYWIRSRYLDTYTQLKEVPLHKPDANELHPDVNSAEPSPAFHNYLDDFLQAIRVFGFLEKPVFHELARHLQTRRLIAGDSMSLDQDNSFYCVIDGTVQVFAETAQASDGQDMLWEEDNMNGYQLLNVVGSGGMLSSLFTILSLFTDDVKMSWQDDSRSDPETCQLPPPILGRSRTVGSNESPFDSDMRVPGARPRRQSSMSSSSSTIHGPGRVSPISRSSSIYESMSGTSTPDVPSSARSRLSKKQIYFGGVARASEDSTLAVIPAEAFRRLTKKFPKATGHIVQVILTRFSRATFYAAHNYLGLTKEVLRTEKAINDIACHPLPPYFYQGGGLNDLRHRFDSVSVEESDASVDYFNLRPSSTGSTLKDLDPLGEGKSRTTERPISLFTPIVTQHHASRHQVQAGDLMSTVGSPTPSEAYRPATRSYSVLNTPRPRSKSFAEDSENMLNLGHSRQGSSSEFNLREEVMSCIAKSIGLLQPPLSGSDSVETSPEFPATDSLRARNSHFSFSSFGSLSLLDSSADDVSSVTGSSIMAGDMTGLDNEVEVLFFPAGSVLVKAGERDTGLFYVIDGFLDILLPNSDSSHSNLSALGSDADGTSKGKGRSQSIPDDTKVLFTVKPGGIAGYLASLCNMPSYAHIRAKTDTYVGFLPSNALDRLIEKRPIVLLTLAKRLISLLSPLILHIDASLDWMQVDAGQILWRPEDSSDSFYIVINGRLRAISEKPDGSVSILREYGQGDTVGELDVIAGLPRRTTVHAIRDTELIRMPRTLFNAISSRNPQSTTQLLGMIASRIRDEVHSLPNQQTKNLSSELGRNNTNLKTIAILPVSRNVPVEAFARKLQTALENLGAPTSYLNQASVSNHLGRHAFTRMGKLKAAGWLADQEQKYRTVLYVADSPVSNPWTQTCIRQADCVMVVGMGDDPSVGEYERLLLSMKTTARKELILLHPDRSVVPGSTREWLKNRPWIHQHIHVELPGLVLPVSKTVFPSQQQGAVITLKNLRDKVQNEIEKYRGRHANPRPQRSANTNDFSRLARRICGKAIGVVLGGGGARGISHLGALRALEDYDIPIDHIAGTSIGAFVGGLYAREADILSSSGRVKKFSSRLGNVWRILSDVTYPIVAYTTGHEFNRAIYKAFYDLHIEDMWLPYFCNTTNINTSQMNIHETGYAWRFIRASMTLVGLLPPLCDNGNMLVDGGYIDNLPVSAMFSMGASVVFAIDVGSIEDNSPRNFGDHVSGWWLLINRWNPFSHARTIPAIPELQSRLAYVSSVRFLEEAKVARGCIYMQMPVQEYGTLQFSKFEEILQKGYDAAKQLLAKFDENGELPSLTINGEKDTAKGKEKKGLSARRNSI